MGLILDVCDYEEGKVWENTKGEKFKYMSGLLWKFIGDGIWSVVVFNSGEQSVACQSNKRRI
jgi:hypothetical protein